MRLLPILFLACGLAACQPASAPDAGPSTTVAADEPAATVAVDEPAAVFDGIRADETVKFTGTEPFWGGEIAQGTARYSTPENIDGESFAVTRFAGNNGVSFSGTMSVGKWDMMVTPGTCSDGMSDRSYPFTATLTIGTQQLQGCAWTERRSFTGPANP